MITKKLFTPKCQHVDRDLVFRDDLDNFYIDFLNWMNDPNNKQIVLNNKQIKEKNLLENNQIKKNLSSKIIKFDDKNILNNNPPCTKNEKIQELENLNKCDKNNTEDFIHNLEEFIECKNAKEALNEGNKDIFSLDESIHDEIKIENKRNSQNLDMKSPLHIKNENSFADKIFLKNQNYDDKINQIDNRNIKISQTENILNNLDYNVFKFFWKEKSMSLLHFCKSKEENYKEYYEVLFGEVQSFLIENDLRRKAEYKEFIIVVQILAIYTLYSLYFTQTTDFFYQINTIPEYLIKINQIIKTLLKVKLIKIARELLLMVFRLHKAEAFSIRVIPGLKTIILNKYGLPCEQKTNTYNDYLHINNSYKNLYLKEDNSYLNSLINQYKNLKFDSLFNIKNVFNQNEFDKEMYCGYINNKNKLVECSKNDLAFLRIDNNELDKNINNLDLQFNIFDNFI